MVLQIVAPFLNLNQMLLELTIGIICFAIYIACVHVLTIAPYKTLLNAREEEIERLKEDINKKNMSIVGLRMHIQCQIETGANKKLNKNS